MRLCLLVADVKSIRQDSPDRTAEMDCLMEIVADSTIGSGDLIATTGRATWVAGPRGSDAPAIQRRFLMVWRKERDGRWCIARELLNEDL